MRSFVVAAALLACACGDVQKAPDAQVLDAYQPDSPPNPMCGADEMVCNGSCANLMTSEQYCGNCMTSCAVGQGCLAGACVNAFTDCKRVKEVDANAMDGAYVNPANNVAFYCSYTTNTQYEIVVNPYTTAPAGFTVARTTEFADANFIKAFIAIYNNNIGFRAMSTFMTGNCCMGPATGVRYAFGGQQVYTGLGTTGICNTTQIQQGQFMSFGRGAANYGMPLPDNYFTTNPYSENAVCSDGSNAAFFLRRSTIN